MNLDTTREAHGLLVAEGPGGPAVILLVVIGIGVIALAALCISALVSILRSPVLSSNGRAMWILIVVVLQFFGPIAWFTFGRKLPAFGPPDR